MESFAPGDLVHARGSEWIALPSPDPEWLCLRPLSGTEADAQLLHPALEREPVRPSRFRSSRTGRHRHAGRCPACCPMRCICRMRRGAGPFRSAARLAFEPRAYQLVPLLMALRLPDGSAAHRRRRRHRQDYRGGAHLARAHRSGRGRSLCRPVSAASRRSMDRGTQIQVRPRRRCGHGLVRRRLERGLPVSQTLFDAHPYHRRQPRLHQG